MAGVLFFLLIVAALAWMTVGPVLWATWYARRSLRSRQFGLRSLFFAFTIVALLIGTISLLLRGSDW